MSEDRRTRGRLVGWGRGLLTAGALLALGLAGQRTLPTHAAGDPSTTIIATVLNDPSGVVVDTAGTVYIADYRCTSGGSRPAPPRQP